MRSVAANVKPRAAGRDFVCGENSVRFDFIAVRTCL